MDRIDFLEARPGVHLAHDYRPGRGPAILFLPGYASDMSGGKASALDAWAERPAGRCCASIMAAAE